MKFNETDKSFFWRWMNKNANWMLPLFGIFVILLGIFIIFYVAIWVMFIGGIVQVIKAVKSPEVPPLPIAIGIAKFMFCGLGIWAGIFVSLVGGGIVKERW